MPRISLTYTRPQLEIFFPAKPTKFTAVPKGRRFGGTRGGSHACIEWAMDGYPILWGDTIYANIERYIERYFKPALRTADPNDPVQWDWRQREQVLRIGDQGGYIDFRSADKPENWEGFGYRYIFLNEAGIILKNKSLYVNTVLPMLMDFPESELYAIGTPKGKTLPDGSEHPFYSIAKRGEEGVENYRTLRYSSYDNPKLTEHDIDDLKKEINRMSPGEEQQEIYGHFIDSSSGFAFFTCFRLSENVASIQYDPSIPLHITMDFNSAPYMTLLVAQIKPVPINKWRVGFLKEYCLEHPLSTTKAVCEALAADLLDGCFRGHKAGMFYYGDATGKNNSSMATEEIRHNYDIVENVLGRWMNNGSDRVLRRNPPHVKARDFMNDVFAGNLPVEVQFDKDMHTTIRDHINLKQGADGGILKVMVTDPRTHVRYEQWGHCSQAAYYLAIGAFHDLYLEHETLAA